MGLEVRLTDRAKADIDDISGYLGKHWSQKAKTEFLTSLVERMDLISKMPQLYKSSSFKKDVRESVLNRHTIIYYKIVNDSFISILTIRNASRDNA